MNKDLALTLKESGIESQVNEWFEKHESKLIGLGGILDSSEYINSSLTNDLNRLTLLSSTSRRRLEDEDNFREYVEGNLKIDFQVGDFYIVQPKNGDTELYITTPKGDKSIYRLPTIGYSKSFKGISCNVIGIIIPFEDDFRRVSGSNCGIVCTNLKKEFKLRKYKLF